MIGDTAKFLKDHGKIVFYDAEQSFDGFKDELDYALATWQAAEKAGADFVVLCNTKGGCLPAEVGAITKIALGKLIAKLASTRMTTSVSALQIPGRARCRRGPPQRENHPHLAGNRHPAPRGHFLHDEIQRKNCRHQIRRNRLLHSQMQRRWHGFWKIRQKIIPFGGNVLFAQGEVDSWAHKAI